MRSRSTLGAFATVTTLFFIWGAVTSVNDILIPTFKKVFTLSDTEGFLTQFAFFMAYGVVSLPAAGIVARRGSANSIVLALGVMLLGALGMPLAVFFRSYLLVLVALFVIAGGITLLQVAANPLAAVLGPPERSHLRLVLSQAFNSLGTVVGPYLAAHTLLKGGLFDGGEATEAKIADTLGRVDLAYGFVMALILLLGLLIYASRRRITDAAPPAEVGSHISEAFRSTWAVLGACAIFLYVGAEVSIGSTLTNYLEQQSVFAATAEVAGSCVAIYWGCAMVGRFAGSALLRAISAPWLLAVCAGLAALFCLTIFSGTVPGPVAPLFKLITLVLSPFVRWLSGLDIGALTPGQLLGGAALIIGLFNSIMFPVIFTLTIERSRAAASATSGLLCMAIVGGALVPLVFAKVADISGSRFTAFAVPTICYLLIAAFAIAARKAPVIARADAAVGPH